MCKLSINALPNYTTRTRITNITKQSCNNHKYDWDGNNCWNNCPADAQYKYGSNCYCPPTKMYSLNNTCIPYKETNPTSQYITPKT